MAKNHAHRPTCPGAAFALESMESRTLLSGGGWPHDAAWGFSVSVKIEQSWRRDGDDHAGHRRQDRRGDRGENFSLQNFGGNRDNDSWQRRTVAGSSPMTPPWMWFARPDVSRPQSTPSSNGNGNAVNETPPMVVTAPPQKTAARETTAHPPTVTVNEAATRAAESPAATAAPNAAITTSQATSASVLEWVKSGAIYAVEIAGMTPAVVIEHTAPAANTAVEKLGDAEQVVLSAAVHVIAAPARDFHIARLGSPLTLMEDAIGSFIEQSVWPVAEQAVATPHRAWYITLAVLTLDAALLTYYFQHRAQKTKPIFAAVRNRPLMAVMNRRAD